ncbi:urease accessory protein UreE [Marinobacterium nitratireducens]|uniref:Urease accessory protein UreE n=1 Tax=Marinobacterium nitratireducens TaxID=518897 RepID=A0A917ZFJ9_9GAMM|nr:urease accessory protein UreE [Marinobacterium nitratireducens]GGO82045.1 urease accessory protein UreE [Marinobacterium nitratireducens]
MIKLTRVLRDAKPHEAALRLPIDKRIKSRLRAELTDGREVGLFLPRGLVLRHGDLLESDDGLVVQVESAPETVSTVRSTDALLLARACYHLGNRHVPLQVEAGWIRYLHDHVLDDMVRGLGLEVIAEQAPFEPEAGAYQSSGQGHHHHGDDDGHEHSHGGHHHH